MSANSADQVARPVAKRMVRTPLFLCTLRVSAHFAIKKYRDRNKKLTVERSPTCSQCNPFSSVPIQITLQSSQLFWIVNQETVPARPVEAFGSFPFCRKGGTARWRLIGNLYYGAVLELATSASHTVSKTDRVATRCGQQQRNVSTFFRRS